MANSFFTLPFGRFPTNGPTFKAALNLGIDFNECEKYTLSGKVLAPISKAEFESHLNRFNPYYAYCYETGVDMSKHGGSGWVGGVTFALEELDDKVYEFTAPDMVTIKKEVLRMKAENRRAKSKA